MADIQDNLALPESEMNATYAEEREQLRNARRQREQLNLDYIAQRPLEHVYVELERGQMLEQLINDIRREQDRIIDEEISRHVAERQKTRNIMDEARDMVYGVRVPSEAVKIPDMEMKL